MKRLSTLGTLMLTLSATGPMLTANAAGAYQAFKIDGLPGYFAYKQSDEPQLLALAGNLEDGFRLLGLGEVFETDVMFCEAEIDKNGVVTDISDKRYMKLGGQVLKFDLGKTLAQLAIAGLGKQEKVTVHMGDQTKFLCGLSGSADLTVFKIGELYYGVYENPALTINTVLLERLPDGHYLSKQIIASLNRAVVEAMVIDLTAANMTGMPASTIAATQSSGAGTEKRAAAAS